MDEIKLRAGMPWVFVMMLLVFFLGVIVWAVLDPIVLELASMVDQFNDGNEHADKGLASVQTVWDWWPLWFLGALAVFGIGESIRRSRAGGGF